MREYGEDNDINRQKRKPFGLKAERVHWQILSESANARPGGTLSVMVSKIANESIVPGSMYISFKAKPSSSDKGAYFVQNLGRAIVTEKQIRFNGKRATIINEHNEYKLYTDLWLTKAQRKDRILQGIQEPLGLKHRIGAKKDKNGAALTGVTNEQRALAAAYGSTFYIHLDDELFTDISPFCPYYISDNVTIELKLAEAKDVVISSDSDASCSISDIHLEFDGIKHAELAKDIGPMYSSFGVHYDRAQFLIKKIY